MVLLSRLPTALAALNRSSPAPRQLWLRDSTGPELASYLKPPIPNWRLDFSKQPISTPSPILFTAAFTHVGV